MGRQQPDMKIRDNARRSKKSHGIYIQHVDDKPAKKIRRKRASSPTGPPPFNSSTAIDPPAKDGKAGAKKKKMKPSMLQGGSQNMTEL